MYEMEALEISSLVNPLSDSQWHSYLQNCLLYIFFMRMHYLLLESILILVHVESVTEELIVIHTTEHSHIEHSSQRDDCPVQNKDKIAVMRTSRGG